MPLVMEATITIGVEVSVLEGHSTSQSLMGKADVKEGVVTFDH